jgi:probable rRNA maturation factor
MAFEFSFQLIKSASPAATEFKRDDLASLAQFVLESEKVAGPVNLTLDLTNPKRIQALNRRFRGVDRTTDVIAFRYSNALSLREREGVRGSFDGDIAINIIQARLQAKRMRHPTRREIRLLLIHGTLHLLGYTDYEPVPRRRMFKRQNQLLLRWERKNSVILGGRKPRIHHDVDGFSARGRGE